MARKVLRDLSTQANRAWWKKSPEAIAAEKWPWWRRTR